MPNNKSKIATRMQQKGQQVLNLDGSPQGQLISQQVEIQQQHEGPLPHPSILNGYEQTCPGASDRIIKMAENAQEHLIKSSEKSQDNFHEDRQSGRKAGVTVVFLAFVVAVIAIINDHPDLAKSIMTVTVIALASIFVLNKVISLPYFSKPNGDSDSK